MRRPDRLDRARECERSGNHRRHDPGGLTWCPAPAAAVADPRSGGTPAARSAHTAGEQADAAKPAAQTPIAPGTVRLCISPDLRFLMPLRRRAAGQMDMAYDPTATVGHLVQSAGVPLTEVGDLLVSDVPVSWSDRLHDQDRLDVAVRARPQPPERRS